MFSSKRSAFWIAILVLIGFACLVPGVAAAQKLVLTGSSTIAPLVGEFARRFESLNQGVRVDVQTGGSSRGMNDTRNKIANIGMVSRAMKANESDLHAFTIALDGVGIILHINNPVTSLSKQQVIDIYSGKITNWQAVGGKNARITVVNKAEGRSTLELFLAYFGMKNSAIKPHIIIGDNQQGIKTIAGNVNAIGYVSIGAAEHAAGYRVPIKLIALDGHEASVANVRNGSFPLSRPLNLITASIPQGLTKDFITFSRSQQVHDLIEAQYFVPVSDD